MPLDIDDPSGRNTVSIGWGCAGINGKIRFSGKGSVVHIARGCTAHFINFDIASNVTIRIGRRCGLGALMIYAADDTAVTIEQRTNFNSLVRLLLHEKGAIAIGADCLIAAQTDLTISDMHSVLDASSGRRINPAADIVVSDHVWIGEGALILKGVSIGVHSIVGARAVLTKDVPAGVVVAGNPARIVRRDVTWDHRLLRP